MATDERINTRFPSAVTSKLDQLAIRRGLLHGGDPNRSAVIARLVDWGLQTMPDSHDVGDPLTVISGQGVVTVSYHCESPAEPVSA